MTTQHSQSQVRIIIACIALGVLGRLLPHLPNVTPMTSLSLFAGSRLQRVAALLTVLLTLLISDALLAVVYGYPLFGSWTFFVYSGFLTITSFSINIVKARSTDDKVSVNWKVLPCWLVSMSFAYWLWSNFGVWLTSDIYTKKISGLISCYIAALPFLRNALVGDLIWGGVVLGVFHILNYFYVKREWRNWQTRWI